MLDSLWDRSEADVKDVHQDLGVDRGISVSTIQSTIELLYNELTRSTGLIRCQPP